MSSQRNRFSRGSRNLLNIFSSEVEMESHDQSDGSGNEVEGSPRGVYLNTSLGRLQFIGSTERAALFQQLNLLNAIRRRRRLEEDYSDDDENRENENEINKRFDLDFRTYPISINWYEVENNRKDYFAILDKFGYFGVAIYSSAEKIKNIKVGIENFLYSIFAYFSNAFIDPKNNKQLSTFINYLPSAQQIREVVEGKKYIVKEIPVLLLILKIYEIYYIKYDKPCFTDLIYNVLVAETIIAENIDEETWKKVIGIMKENNDIEKLMKNLKGKIHQTKKKFIEHLNKIKQKCQFLIDGISKEKFVL